MASVLNPYLSFESNAREAMEFYKSVFGGDLRMTTFGEGKMTDNPADEKKIMHGQLETKAGYTLTGSDTPPNMGPTRPNGQISLSGDDDATLRGYWDKLSAGGSVMMPLAQAPWGDSFGMLTDKFGVSWMVNIAGKKA